MSTSTLDWFTATPPSQAVLNAVARAVKSGKLIRPDRCSECGRPCKPDAHHEDYAKSLEVIWLCEPCHGRADAVRRQRLGPKPLADETEEEYRARLRGEPVSRLDPTARFQSFGDASILAEISKRTISRWVNEGHIKAYSRPGDRHRYVDLDEIKAYREQFTPIERKGEAEARQEPPAQP